MTKWSRFWQEAGHDLAEGTKAKLKAALLTKTAEDEIGPDPFLGRFDSRESFPQELARHCPRCHGLAGIVWTG